MTRLVRLIPSNSKVLLGLFLAAQNVTDETLLECRYPPSPPLPDIDSLEFPKDEKDLTRSHDRHGFRTGLVQEISRCGVLVVLGVFVVVGWLCWSA